MVASNTLTFHHRFSLEISALREAGAHVRVITFYDDSPAPEGIEAHTAPLFAQRRPALNDLLPAYSTIRSWSLRRAHNHALRVMRAVALRPPVRPVLERILGPEKDSTERIAALRQMAPNTDIFWVIDFLNLETTVQVARQFAVPVIYETIDLVPEYDFMGREWSAQALRTEAELMPHVSGFITASEGYADYYVERYGGIAGFRRPVVRDNATETIVSAIVPTAEKRRFLFQGALTFDRPILELIEAAGLAGDDVDLTFQGENFLGDAPQELIDQLCLGDRVRLIPPCPPGEVVRAAVGYDVGIVALRGTNENERRATTTKLFTYMAAGLAILASDLPGIARVVTSHANGELVPDPGPHSWALAMAELAAAPSGRIDALKQRSLEASAEHHWDRQAPDFVKEFCRVLGR